MNQARRQDALTKVTPVNCGSAPLLEDALLKVNPPDRNPPRPLGRTRNCNHDTSGSVRREADSMYPAPERFIVAHKFQDAFCRRLKVYYRDEINVGTEAGERASMHWGLFWTMYSTHTENHFSASSSPLNKFTSPGTYFAAIVAGRPAQGLRRVLPGG